MSGQGPASEEQYSDSGRGHLECGHGDRPPDPKLHQGQVRVRDCHHDCAPSQHDCRLRQGHRDGQRQSQGDGFPLLAVAQKRALCRDGRAHGPQCGGNQENREVEF